MDALLQIRIDATGTALRYKPGILIGGELTHDCGCSRSIGYFLQPLLILAPFAKQQLELKLLGVTNDEMDVGIDLLRTVTMPMMRHFGVPDASLRIVKRGAPPSGGGEVQLSIPIVRELEAVELTEFGRVKRVRGVAYGAKVSPQIANRMVEAARSTLNNYLPDVWYVDLPCGHTHAHPHAHRHARAQAQIRTYTQAHTDTRTRARTRTCTQQPIREPTLACPHAHPPTRSPTDTRTLSA
eukprot:6187653-Pleurochrysis_carterae.AAC.2